MLSRRGLCSALIVCTATLLLAGACGDGDDADPSPTVEPTSTSEPTGDPEATPTPEPTSSPALQAIEGALTGWQALGSEEYTYTYSRACECTQEVAGPNVVHVRDGDVVRVDHFGTDIDPALGGWTIDELLDMAREAVLSGKDVDLSLLASGVPVYLRLDLEALAVDGGFSIDVSEFEDRTKLRREFEDARALWEASDTADYDLTYRWLCFCPVPRFAIEVRDGEVATWEVLEGQAFIDPLTVDGLFDRLEEALDAEVAGISATYDEVTGVPLEAQVDVARYIVDEEWGFDDVEVTVR